MNGFLAEMSAHDIPATAPVLGDWTVDLGYELGLKLLSYREFTAVFASNDQMALGIMHSASDLGLSVPRDLSVVGFDDIPEAKHFFPPLTTVRQNFPELGTSAIDVLLAEIEATPAPLSVQFTTPELIVRKSTAPAR
jgi:DNA-binding LacI/PurR family transcriptional regulator